MMITVFKNATDTKEPHYVHIDVMLERIKNCKVQQQVDKIRAEKDDKKNKALKRKLPSIVFAGKFSEREDWAILEHSGKCILDFDKLKDVELKKKELMEHSFIYAAFESPNGNGIKAVVNIPPDAKKHRGHYRALLKIFPELDTTSINESRVCFESCDKNIYINKNATVFTDYIETIESEKIITTTTKTATYTNYSKADIPLRMIRDAIDGHKHATLLKASKLMGGYVTGGLVQESEAIRLLENEIKNKNIDDFEGAQKTIQDGIVYGKSKPIFEVEEEFNIKSSTGILEIDEVWESMKHSFLHGKERGGTTHFKKFDENFTWKKGEITLIIGRPNAGKSELAFHLMLLKSIFDGWKWGVFSPENFPADEFYDTLIHSYIGKTTDPYFTHGQMTLDEYKKGYEFVREHFFYVYPEEHTIEKIDSNFLFLIEEKKINGTLIDPFNQIEIDFNERDDLFLSKFLRNRKRVATRYNLCDIMTSHPKSMSRNKTTGEYDVPDMYDISMGAMWSNKMDNIMTVHRPKYMQDPTDTSVEVHVRKIKKQKLVGVPGMCPFNFSRKTNRYYQNSESPLETEKQNGQPFQTRITPKKEKKKDEINLPF